MSKFNCGCVVTIDKVDGLTLRRLVYYGDEQLYSEASCPRCAGTGIRQTAAVSMNGVMATEKIKSTIEAPFALAGHVTLGTAKAETYWRCDHDQQIATLTRERDEARTEITRLNKQLEQTSISLGSAWAQTVKDSGEIIALEHALQQARATLARVSADRAGHSNTDELACDDMGEL